MLLRIPNLPVWLKPGLKIPDEEMPRLKSIAANWLVLSKERPNLTETDCLRIICLELAGRRRPEQIMRTAVWFFNKRRVRELDELLRAYPNACTRSSR